MTQGVAARTTGARPASVGVASGAASLACRDHTGEAGAVEGRQLPCTAGSEPAGCGCAAQARAGQFAPGTPASLGGGGASAYEQGLRAAYEEGSLAAYEEGLRGDQRTGGEAGAVIPARPLQAGDGQAGDGQAERWLADSDDRFRIAFETSEEAISISRMRDGLYVDVNAAFARLFGFSKRELIGKTALDLGIWPDKAARDSFVSGLTGQPRIRDRVLQLRRIDGRERTMMVSATRCVLAGEPHLLASLRDVTEVQRTEMELRKLWQAVEQSSVAVLITSADGCIEYINPCFIAITGYSRAEAVGRTPSILKSGLTPDSDYRRLWETITRGDAWQGEFCNRRKDGSLFWGVASVSPLLDAQGRVTHFVGIQADITERKRAEQELRASEARFRSLVDTSLLGICIEANGKPLFANQTFAEIFGYRDAAEVMALGSLSSFYVPGEAGPLTGHDATASANRSELRHEVRGLRKDGSIVWLQAQSRVVPWNDGMAVQTAVLDITLRKQYEERLRHQANFDPVTGLPNRNLALDRLVSAIESARRRASRVSVLFIDVDRFKQVNDTLGHAAGDRFLRQVGQRLKAAIRQMDTVGRLGGDEFVVVLSDVRLRSDAEAIAAKVSDACAEPFILDGREAFATLSVGIANFPEDGDNAEELLRHADAAMYLAKENGRSQVRLYQPEGWPAES